MMKAIKKLMAMTLALIMMFALALPAGAVSDNNTLTITSKTSGHTYQAYQVFDGDYYDGVLSNVKWGDGVDGPGLLAALKADEGLKTHFASCNTAVDVAEVLSKDGSPFTNNSQLLDELADVVSKHLTQTHKDSGSPSGQAPNLTYTISGLKDGYYFVNEANMGNADNNAYTKFMLQVVGDTTVAAKADVPTIDKNFAEGGSQDNASIGDEIHFKLTSKVPNMDGYDKYFFVVHDTLSTGLTFKAGSVVVKVGTETLTADEDFTVTSSGQSLKIVLNDFIQYKTSQPNANIEITYTATLNENAVVGVQPNPNDVYLEYSNNPNVDYEGDNEPAGDDPVGKTPHDRTYTYVTGLELKKVDPDGKALTGAQFKLEGDTLNTVLVYRDTFTEDPDGTYWKLKDGTYTTTAPTEDTGDKYEDTETKYTCETVKDTVIKEGEEVTATGTVGDDGILRFEGLSAGTYTITELVAPDGYNLLDQPITVSFTWSAPSTEGGNCTWTVTSGNADVVNGIITLTIENDKGSTLPETGGIGTTIFYVVGGILVVGAGVLLVAKKRMNADSAK